MALLINANFAIPLKPEAARLTGITGRNHHKLDWTTIVDGLYVSGLGMGMVMAVLVLLAITVWLVSRADRAIDARQRKQEQVDAPEVAIDEVATPAGDENLANVAVIAVAIALAEAAEQDAMRDVGPAIDVAAVPANDWLTQGRTRQWSRQSGNASEVWKR